MNWQRLSGCTLRLTLIIIISLTTLCGCRKNPQELIHGSWQPEDGKILMFRDFTEEDDPRWRNLGSTEPDGVYFIMTVATGRTVNEGVYTLEENGRLALYELTDLKTGPFSTIMSYDYVIDELTEDHLVFHSIWDKEKVYEYTHIESSEAQP